MENITLKEVDNNKSSLIISKCFAKKNNFLYVRNSIIRFGYKAVEINVDIDEELDEDVVLISKNILKNLSLPMDCIYNFKIDNGEIIIGPFIGIYMGERKKTYNRNLRMLSNYVKKYEDIKGAVFGFTLDEIYKDKLMMKGLLYNPKLNVWEFKELPYPASILKKRELDKDWREYFTSIYKDKMFNYKHIDKWEMYERLSQLPELNELLPPTRLYDSFDSIVEFLKEYKDVYIKPIAGNRGLGIYNVVYDNSLIRVKTRTNDENKTWEFKEIEEFRDFVEKHLTLNEYIIQKSLQIKVNNKTLDFRVGFDKDQSGEWQNIMFVTRISGERSIVSNVATSGGTVCLPHDALTNFYNMSEIEAKEYVEKLKETGYKIAKAMDSTGLYFGKLALDLIIDVNKKLWLIEVNNKNPNDTMMSMLGDKDTFFNIRLTNMLYSKYLAGFEIETNKNILFIEPLENKNQDKLLRYHISVSIPGKVKKYKSYLKELGEQYNLVGFIKSKPNKKFVEFEIEGNKNTLQEFIKSMQSNEFSDSIKGIALKEIDPLKSEKSFTLGKNDSNKQKTLTSDNVNDSTNKKEYGKVSLLQKILNKNI